MGPGSEGVIRQQRQTGEGKRAFALRGKMDGPRREGGLPVIAGFVEKRVTMKTVERLLSIAHTPVEPSVVEAPPPLDYYNIQRRGGRVRLSRRFWVQLQSRDATLIDISLSGALVEHAARSRPGEVYRLSLPTEGGQLQMRARAVRALVSHHVSAEEGERRLVYQTGLEFVGFGERLAEVLVIYIDRLRRQHVL